MNSRLILEYSGLVGELGCAGERVNREGGELVSAQFWAWLLGLWKWLPLSTVLRRKWGWVGNEEEHIVNEGFYGDWDLWAVKGQIWGPEERVNLLGVELRVSKGSRRGDFAITTEAMGSSKEMLSGASWKKSYRERLPGFVVKQGGVIKSLLAEELQGEVARGGVLRLKGTTTSEIKWSNNCCVMFEIYFGKRGNWSWFGLVKMIQIIKMCFF